MLERIEIKSTAPHTSVDIINLQGTNCPQLRELKFDNAAPPATNDIWDNKILLLKPAHVERCMGPVASISSPCSVGPGHSQSSPDPTEAMSWPTLERPEIETTGPHTSFNMTNLQGTNYPQLRELKFDNAAPPATNDIWDNKIGYNQPWRLMAHREISVSYFLVTWAAYLMDLRCQSFQGPFHESHQREASDGPADHELPI